jgi:hypothetical protein
MTDTALSPSRGRRTRPMLFGNSKDTISSLLVE